MKRLPILFAVGLPIVVFALVRCATPGTPGAGPIAPDRPPAPWVPHPAKDDEMYKRISKDFDHADLASDARLRETSKKLLDALNFYKIKGVRVSESVTCGANFGCATDVYYDNPLVFKQFQDTVNGARQSPVRDYDHGGGRSGMLLNGDGKFVAKWYFITSGLAYANDEPRPPEDKLKGASYRTSPKKHSAGKMVK